MLRCDVKRLIGEEEEETLNIQVQKTTTTAQMNLNTFEVDTKKKYV